jgi:hypothetical protein
MQKWEYMTLTANLPSGKVVNFINDQAVGMRNIALFPYLNKLGNEGWEIIAYSNNTFVLKRPKG